MSQVFVTRRRAGLHGPGVVAAQQEVEVEDDGEVAADVVGSSTTDLDSTVTFRIVCDRLLREFIAVAAI